MSRSRSKSAGHDSELALYWRESARPLTSLAFVAPMLVAYEVGVLWLDQHAARNGADVWLRTWLAEGLGFGSYFLLPLLTCGLLLAWHHTQNEAWRLRWNVLSGMACESSGLALVLLMFAHWQQQWWSLSQQPAWCATQATTGDMAAQLVAYFGAGIYEELLFRLALLPLSIMALQWCGLRRRPSVVTAVVLTSALFALAHYRCDFVLGGWHFSLPCGDEFAWSSFTFRFLAGSFFASLFVTRGFGIAAGAHALYDIFAVLL